MSITEKLKLFKEEKSYKVKRRLGREIVLEYCKKEEKLKEVVSFLTPKPYKKREPSKEEAIKKVKEMFKENNSYCNLPYDECKDVVSKALRSSNPNKRIWIMWNMEKKRWELDNIGRYPTKYYVGELV